MKYWIWLSRIKNIGPLKIRKLLQEFKTPENIWKLTKNELLKVNGIGEKNAQEILNPMYRENLDKFESYMRKYNIGIVNLYDNMYPSNLKQIYDAPAILYYKGNKELLKKNNMIALVGSRECSNYGKKVSFKLSYELAKKDLIIVSGMAKGIDSYSHLGCINAKGKTIAVLGNGLDQIYPKENIKLYNSILNNEGLILSEYVIGTKPQKLNFPARNRIITGISRALVVVEAKEKSGTANTVDFALEQGKDVYAIPGNIISENSKGTNELIKQGAKCITCTEDILNELNYI